MNTITIMLLLYQFRHACLIMMFVNVANHADQMMLTRIMYFLYITYCIVIKTSTALRQDCNILSQPFVCYLLCFCLVHEAHTIRCGCSKYQCPCSSWSAGSCWCTSDLC